MLVCHILEDILYYLGHIRLGKCCRVYNSLLVEAMALQLPETKANPPLKRTSFISECRHYSKAGHEHLLEKSPYFYQGNCILYHYETLPKPLLSGLAASECCYDRLAPTVDQKDKIPVVGFPISNPSSSQESSFTPILGSFCTAKIPDLPAMWACLGLMAVRKPRSAPDFRNLGLPQTGPHPVTP